MKKLKQWRTARLLRAFNAVSGVVAGLEELKQRPGSTFDYVVKQRPFSVEIETNVPATGYRDVTKVNVISNGATLHATGDALPLGLGYAIPSTVTAEAGDALGERKVVNFVARHARLSGMLK